MATSSTTYGNYRYRKVRIEVMPDYVKMWCASSNSNNSGVTLTNNNLVKWSGGDQVSLIPGYDGSGTTKTYRGGYGPLISYRGHNCDGKTNVQLSNLSMEAEFVKSLTQTIRGPQWDADKQSFMVNLNEQPISDFSNVYTSSEIINRLADEDVTYIGWCGGDNYADSMKFVEGVGNNSALISIDGQTTVDNADTITSGYTAAARKTQIKAIAKAIVNKINSKKTAVTENTYLETDDFRFSVLGTTLSDGKWSVGYSTTSYDESKNSVTKYNNLESASFNDVGYYEVYYDEDYEHPKAKIRIHKAPVANFAVSVGTSGNEQGTLVVNNKSYDPEFVDDAQISNADGSALYGITGNKIEYRNMTDQTDWTENAPTATEVAGKV